LGIVQLFEGLQCAVKLRACWDLLQIRSNLQWIMDHLINIGLLVLGNLIIHHKGDPTSFQGLTTLWGGRTEGLIIPKETMVLTIGPTTVWIIPRWLRTKGQTFHTEMQVEDQAPLT
jgi:hypothetical protein